MDARIFGPLQVLNRVGRVISAVITQRSLLAQLSPVLVFGLGARRVGHPHDDWHVKVETLRVEPGRRGSRCRRNVLGFH